MYEIFISYRRSDAFDIANDIKGKLSANYKVFLDISCIKTDVWRKKLNQALEESSVILCLLSRNYFEEWGKPDDCVKDELNFAIENNKIFIPVEIKGSFRGFPNSLPCYIKKAIGGIQFAPIHRDQSYDRDLQDLIDRLQSIIERSRGERRRGENEIRRACNYLWGINGENRDLQTAYSIFTEVYRTIPYLTDALVGIGLCFRENGQDKEAIDCFEEAGQKGNGEAYYLIAQIYENKGESPLLIWKYYDLSAELDFAPALIKKGLEEKSHHNLKKALSYLNKAADLGDSNGFYQCALIFEAEGMALNNDVDCLQKSLEFLNKAVDNGNAEAMNHLGIMYYQGKVLKKDDRRAFVYISKAADAGFVQAQFNKGVMLYEGMGVSRDKKLGKKWLEKASRNGSEEAMVKLKEINRGIWHVIGNLFE